MILLVSQAQCSRTGWRKPYPGGWSGRSFGTDTFQSVSVQFNSIDILISRSTSEPLVFDIMTWHIVVRYGKHQKSAVFGLNGELPFHVELWLPNVDVFNQGRIVGLSGMMSRSSSLVSQQEGTPRL